MEFSIVDGELVSDDNNHVAMIEQTEGVRRMLER
jgi:hypothetical protein